MRYQEIAAMQRLAAKVERRARDARYTAVASTAMQDLLAALYKAYQRQGLEGIEPYARSSKKTVDTGHQLRLTNEALEPVLIDFFPDYYDALVNCPDSAGWRLLARCCCRLSGSIVSGYLLPGLMSGQTHWFGSR